MKGIENELKRLAGVGWMNCGNCGSLVVRRSSLQRYCQPCRHVVNLEIARAQYAKHRHKHLESKRERQKRIRAERRAAGLCLECGKHPSPPGENCPNCRVKRRKSGERNES